MSTASVVPETRGLTGDDLRRTLRTVGLRRLLVDSFRRLSLSDGFSHARSLAYVTSLVVIQGVIAAVGLARVLHSSGVSNAVDATLRQAIPGPAGRVLTTAVLQAHQVAADHRYLALIVGGVGALITATSGLGQLERGLNRLYGIEQDRTVVRKYFRALILTLSVGVLITIAFVSLAFGQELFSLSGKSTVARTWAVVHWPLGLILIALAVTLLFLWSPRRQQPHFSWLLIGSGISVVLWGLCTIGLGVFFRASSTFGETYGPLAGIVALLLWSLLSNVALLYGAAVAAQLEAVRAGQHSPQDDSKVQRSDSSDAVR
ncbi:MAG: YihY/virulence factor BrkB family protein [Acidimicrobiaceae bacterium]|nr:YihY/virulence factor BrkB family protein [Acidimicrobiaceae bacterium]